MTNTSPCPSPSPLASRSRSKAWTGAWLLLVLCLLLAACAGHQWAGVDDLWRALMGDDSLRSRLLLQWRLPRVFAAACVGALLGLSGAIFQGVFRNPLAEPYLLGASGGAALGATVALLVPLGLPQAWTLPALAFAGAWGSTVLVLAVARVAGALDAAGLLLAGVALAAMLGALRSFMMLALSDETVSLQVVMGWVLGGIQTPTWQGLLVLAAITAGCVAATRALAGGLDVLGLGDTAARGFGLDVARFIPLAVLAGSLVVAAAVAYGGLVAFVGLAAPHIARWMVGPMHRVVLPASALVGAVVVTVADALARSVLPPAEIPLGLITAIAGGPFFIVLLARRLRAA
jgi:iron complex transport system permease protein